MTEVGASAGGGDDRTENAEGGGQDIDHGKVEKVLAAEVGEGEKQAGSGAKDVTAGTDNVAEAKDGGGAGDAGNSAGGGEEKKMAQGSLEEEAKADDVPERVESGASYVMVSPDLYSSLVSE